MEQAAAPDSLKTIVLLSIQEGPLVGTSAGALIGPPFFILPRHIGKPQMASPDDVAQLPVANSDIAAVHGVACITDQITIAVGLIWIIGIRAVVGDPDISIGVGIAHAVFTTGTLSIAI